MIMMQFTRPDVSLLDFVVPLFSLFNFVLLWISVSLFYRRFKKDHDWNRRQATQHLLFELVTGRFSETCRQLAVEFGVTASKTTESYSDKFAMLDEVQRRPFLSCTKSILNYLETIAIGMRNHVLSEDICYDHCSVLFVQYCRWAKPLIKEARGQHPTLWIELEHYARKWEKRLDQEVEQMLPPQKRPT